MAIIDKIKMNTNPLELGVLLDINTRSFGGSSSLSDDDLKEMGLDPDVYRAIHAVLSQDGMDSLADIRTISNRAKRQARQFGMHTPFRGLILIPNGAVNAVDAMLEEEKAAFQRTVNTFLEGYNDYKIDFSEKHPKLAEKFEYPDIEKLAKAFRFKWFWRKFEVPSTLPADMARREELEMKGQGRDILVRFIQDSIGELVNRINSLSKQFDKGTIWRKNAVGPMLKSIEKIRQIGSGLVDDVPELRDSMSRINEVLNGVDLASMEVEAVLESVIEPLEKERDRLIEF